ncbi:hypothetical protein QBC35DRAFT_463768 [Podospora australis]|uniref:Ankyrin n=1 Tax=Podospora australis TaxID=1536484 RepID=A0AAN6WTU6_9PEZI|nr:hypothetical protein QBC35DRAFT_463768 [Podospora australis]
MDHDGLDQGFEPGGSLGYFIATGSPEFLDGLFTLGTHDGTDLPTHPGGVYTREAALVVAMLVGRRNHDLLMCLASGHRDHIFFGRIPLLRNATLLHVACTDETRTLEITRCLLALEHAPPEDDGLRWDVNALTSNLQTPLMLAAQNTSTPDSLDLVKLLLARGADPYLRGSDVKLEAPGKTRDLLRTNNGRPVSRYAVKAIQKAAKSRFTFDIHRQDLSAFEIAIYLGRLDMVKEFLKQGSPPSDQEE